MRKTNASIWAYLFSVFAAVGMAVAVLPGCGDDVTKDESDTESDTESESDSEFSPPDSPDIT